MKTLAEFYTEFYNKQARSQRHFEAHLPVIKVAMELAPQWSDNAYHYDPKAYNRTVSITYAEGLGTINCVSLDLYLGAEDTLAKDVMLWVEEFADPAAESLGLEFKAQSDYTEMKWRSFTYHNKDTNWPRDPHFMVRAWWERSQKCYTIGTGKMVEEQKVVCE